VTFRPALLSLGALVLVGLVFAAVPALDRAVSALFHVGGGFPLATNPVAGAIREVLQALPTVLGVVSLVALALWRFVPFLRRLDPRALAAFVLALVLGPGLLVNGLLKTHWDRPRPIQITEFGGAMVYKPWWDPRGACEDNCSFVSGEGSAAGSLLFLALAAPPLWRRRAVGLALVVMTITGSMRVAFGGHFASDVIMGVLMTWLIGFLALRLLPEPPASP
jgi:lipid A 4'-phosphatase